MFIRILLALGVLLSAQLMASFASGASCPDAFESAQLLRNQDKLLSSREQLAICAQDSCPAFIRDKCVTWLAEVDAAIPTVLIIAFDPEGATTTDVRVTVDDKLMADSLAGAIQLDPGERKLRFERDGSPAIEETLTVKAGEKDRRLEVRFERSATDPLPSPYPTPDPVPDPTPDPTPDPQPRVPEDTSAAWFTATWVLFGVAAAGGIVGVVVGVRALDDAEELEAECLAEGCTEGQIGKRARLADVATAVFVAAGVLAAAGVVTLSVALTSPESSASDQVRVRLGPTGADLEVRF